YSPSLLLHIEKICTRFENAWKAGRRPRVHDFLGGTPEPARTALLQELEAVEREYRDRIVPTVGPAHQPGEEHQAIDEGARQAGKPALPVRLGRYRITAQLGAGSFGVVFKGYDEGLRREVAIKVPHPQRISHPGDVEAYLAEARILASLD